MLVARRLREGADEVRSLPQAVNKCAPTPADVAARAEVGVGWRVWEARSKNESRCIDRSHVIHLFNSPQTVGDCLTRVRRYLFIQL